MEDQLDRTIEFARRAHGEQQRQFSPEPYIQHPIRVMNCCREYVSELPVLHAAILHDVLEDTPIKSEELHAFLLTIMDPPIATITIQLVTELTDVYIKTSFPQWNRRRRKQMEASRLSKTSAAAQTIKYADIIDNSLTIAGADSSFARKYLLECQTLLKEMDKGNNELRQRALKVVEKCLEEL